MKIALDYDGTYTQDPDIWDEFITLFLEAGHDIRMVTSRNINKDKIVEGTVWVDIPVIYCNGVAKRFVCHHDHDWDPDIWIDDHPEMISHNSEHSRDWLMEWRANRNE